MKKLCFYLYVLCNSITLLFMRSTIWACYLKNSTTPRQLFGQLHLNYITSKA